MKITGPGAGKAFQHETGKHCCQRIPVTETKGRKQTSVVTVAALPIKQEAEREPLKEADLEVTTQTGRQKAGGQNANKVNSAVRMKHIPTGLTVFINGRDQLSNRRDALDILTTRVNELKKSQADAEYADIRNERLADGNRSDKIRTYNFMESRVTDHRLGSKTGNIKGIMKGRFDLLFKED